MRSRRSRTHFVPKLVLGATFVAVVPACVLVACGGTTTSGDGGSDAQSEFLPGVAAVAYCCFDAMGVADAAFAKDADAADSHEGG